MQDLITVALVWSSLASATLSPRQSSIESCDDYDGTADCASESELANTCTPTNSSGGLDLNAPCNLVTVMTAECLYGKAGIDAILGSGNDSSDGQPGDLSTLSNADQRYCICSESPFFEEFEGCNACYKAHGAPPDGLLGYLDDSLIGKFQGNYCAAALVGPSQGFTDYLSAFASTAMLAIESSFATATTSAYSDPLGNNTAVSLYYTRPFTGSPAWSNSFATVTDSCCTSLKSSDGHSEATATTASAGSAGSGSGTASGTVSGAASTSSSGSAAMKTEALAIAGVVALAGLVVGL